MRLKDTKLATRKQQEENGWLLTFRLVLKLINIMKYQAFGSLYLIVIQLSRWQKETTTVISSTSYPAEYLITKLNIGSFCQTLKHLTFVLHDQLMALINNQNHVQKFSGVSINRTIDNLHMVTTTAFMMNNMRVTSTRINRFVPDLFIDNDAKFLVELSIIIQAQLCPPTFMSCAFLFPSQCDCCYLRHLICSSSSLIRRILLLFSWCLHKEGMPN